MPVSRMAAPVKKCALGLERDGRDGGAVAAAAAAAPAAAAAAAEAEAEATYRQRDTEKDRALWYALPLRERARVSTISLSFSGGPGSLGRQLTAAADGTEGVAETDRDWSGWLKEGSEAKAGTRTRWAWHWGGGDPSSRRGIAGQNSWQYSRFKWHSGGWAGSLDHT